MFSECLHSSLFCILLASCRRTLLVVLCVIVCLNIITIQMSTNYSIRKGCKLSKQTRVAGKYGRYSVVDMSISLFNLYTTTTTVAKQCTSVPRTTLYDLF